MLIPASAAGNNNLGPVFLNLAGLSKMRWHHFAGHSVYFNKVAFESLRVPNFLDTDKLTLSSLAATLFLDLFEMKATIHPVLDHRD